VTEVPVPGDPTRVRDLQRRYVHLVLALRGLMLRAVPHGLTVERRVRDGDDVDYDAAVQAMLDQRTGVTPSDAVYRRLRRHSRDVAVGLLLDISSSTAERVREADPLEGGAVDAPPWQRPRPPRILDLELLAALLCLAAIDAVGDASAAWAFSGTGRERVSMPVLKDFGEPLGGVVLRRAAGVKPMHATRMGAAIRHATRRMRGLSQVTKLLLILSDGRPFDVDYGSVYGHDGVLEYAVSDTSRALDEARHTGVRPYLLTVDAGGEDYLRAMCSRDYEVLTSIGALPQRLTGLYRDLAATPSFRAAPTVVGA
jgi:nitric oxide reductase activation protein